MKFKYGSLHEHTLHKHIVIAIKPYCWLYLLSLDPDLCLLLSLIRSGSTSSSHNPDSSLVIKQVLRWRSRNCGSSTVLILQLFTRLAFRIWLYSKTASNRLYHIVSIKPLNGLKFTSTPLVRSRKKSSLLGYLVRWFGRLKFKHTWQILSYLLRTGIEGFASFPLSKSSVPSTKATAQKIIGKSLKMINDLSYGTRLIPQLLKIFTPWGHSTGTLQWLAKHTGWQ